MSTKARTSFEQIGRWQLDGRGDDLPPALTVLETTATHFRSREVTARCSNPECDFTGTAAKYDNRNTYWVCPECGRESMVPKK